MPTILETPSVQDYFAFRKNKDEQTMGSHEFYSNNFMPRTEQQQSLFEDFKRLRMLFGTPHRFAYLRSLARTRRHVRTVYPPGWKP
jgi:hypothetical protein